MNGPSTRGGGVIKGAASQGKLEFRLATVDDAAECNALHTAFHHHGRTTEQWLWQFASSGGPLPYAIAIDGARVIGTQGLLLVPMVRDSGPFLSAKGEDALVLPEYWSRDVLSKLWILLIEYARNNGIQLLWGFNSRKGSFKRVGFRYFVEADCRFMIRPLHHSAVDVVLANTSRAKKAFERPGGNVLKTALGIGALVAAGARHLTTSITAGRRLGVIVSDDNEQADEFDALSRRFVDRYGGATVFRSSAYVRRRLSQNPFRPSTISTARVEGQLAGYVAWCLSDANEAFLTDYLIASPEANEHCDARIAEILLDHVIGRCRDAGAVVTRFTAFNGHRADRLFRHVARRAGFFSYASQVGACAQGVPGAPGHESLLRDYDQWFLTGINFEGRAG